MINSNLFSAQNRRRLYWTNIDINPIKDRKITYDSIKMINDEQFKPATIKMKNGKKYIVFTGEKLNTLTTKIHNSNGLGRPFYSKTEFEVDKPFDYSKIIKLSPIECERLQTIPDNYTDILSNYKRYVCLGNCWTVDVVAHILNGINFKVQTNFSKMLHTLNNTNPFENENCEDKSNCERFDDCSECYNESLKEI